MLSQVLEGLKEFFERYGRCGVAVEGDACLIMAAELAAMAEDARVLEQTAAAARPANVIPIRGRGIDEDDQK